MVVWLVTFLGDDRRWEDRRGRLVGVVSKGEGVVVWLVGRGRRRRPEGPRGSDHRRKILIGATHTGKILSQPPIWVCVRGVLVVRFFGGFAFGGFGFFVITFFRSNVIPLGA